MRSIAGHCLFSIRKFIYLQNTDKGISLKYSSKIQVMIDLAFGLGEIIIILVIIVALIWLIFLRVNRQRQQQQQQIVIQSGNEKTMRVCPKCGCQNDKEAKFCSDCSFKFTQ